MADFMYTRGARRSAAPTYNRWNAPQSAAQTSEQMLAALMRQPQEAQNADPRMMRMNAPQRQQQLGGIDPAALQTMIREQAMAQQAARDAKAFGTESANSRTDVANATSEQAAMGPASPTTMRALKTMMNLGLSGMGLGPITALLSGAISNPGSETMPAAALGTSVVKSKVPALGAIDLVTQMFGVDPIVKEVDKQLQAITQPSAPAGPATPAESGSAGTAVAANWDTYDEFGMNPYGFSRDYGWGNAENGSNFSDSGPGGSSGATDGDGMFGFGRNTSSGMRGAFGGGSGSFGEGQY